MDKTNAVEEKAVITPSVKPANYKATKARYNEQVIRFPPKGERVEVHAFVEHSAPLEKVG
jgi:hypothetical protein